jgi:hypothetical protein
MAIGSFVEVSGSSTGSINSAVTDAEVTIRLSDVTSRSALRISNSKVMLLFSGASEFAGIICAGQSNVTLAFEDGSLLTKSAQGPGLGAPEGDSCGSLAILNGSIWAEASDGSAGIGTGAARENGANSRIGNLRIENANVTGTTSTTWDYGGSGIGTGAAYYNGANSGIGNLTIENANVTGTSTNEYYGGSGIGTGAAISNGDSGIWNLTIENANVTGTSSTNEYYGGSGIGTGAALDNGGNSRIGNLTIENANVTGTSSTTRDYGGSGIGTGAARSNGDSSIGVVILSGALTLVCDLLRARNIFGQNVTIFTPNARLFDTTSGLSGRLMVLYGTVSEKEPSSEGIWSLSIGNLSLPSRGGWRFCVEGQDCSSYIEQEIWGLCTLVPGNGSYSIVAEGRERGFLGPTEDNNTFDVLSTGSFFEVAYFIKIPPTPTPTPRPTASPSDAFATSAALLVSAPIVASYGLSDSDRFNCSATLARTREATSSRAFEASAVALSGPIVESFRLTHSDRFNCSATLEPAHLAESRTLATGSLVAIILASVAVVALAVGLIALRHCRLGSRNGNGVGENLNGEVEWDETPYQTSEFVTSMNPNQGDSDDLADEIFED